MGDSKRGPPPICRVLSEAWVEQAIKATRRRNPAYALSLARVLEESFTGPFEGEARAEAAALAEWLRAVPKD
jgi:hypothetical protein